MRYGKLKNPLSEWLRYAPPDAAKELAEACSTSLNYLRILAHGHRENPRLRLALAIEKNATLISRKYRAWPLPKVTIEDIAAITRRDGD